MKFRLVLNLRPYRHQKLLSIIDTIPRMERGEFLLDLAEEALRIQTQSEPFQTNCESQKIASVATAVENTVRHPNVPTESGQQANPMSLLRRIVGLK